MNKPTDIEVFWECYKNSLAKDTELAATSYTAWSFGHSEELANELAELVMSGVKTATCGLLWEYEVEDEELPGAGDLSIILDGKGKPLCIIETTEVEVKPFNEVDAQFAYDEGEGDRSLTFWRKAHWEVFSEYCTSIGREVSETMPLVCERFRLVHPPASS